MGFVGHYITLLSASSLQDDERHCQAEPLLASALASTAAGHLGALLHRAKYAGTATQNMAHAVAMRNLAEKALADARRNKDASREAECRQALQGDATVVESGVSLVARLLILWTAEGVEARPRAPLGAGEHRLGCGSGDQAVSDRRRAFAGPLAAWSM